MRRAAIEDAEALLAQTRAAIARYTEFAPPGWTVDRLDPVEHLGRIRETLANPEALVEIADDGAGHFAWRPEEGHARLLALFVEPHAWAAVWRSGCTTAHWRRCASAASPRPASTPPPARRALAASTSARAGGAAASRSSRTPSAWISWSTGARSAHGSNARAGRSDRVAGAMTLDCRIDRRELRDPFDLPTLTRERLSWSLPPDQQWPVLEPIRRLTRGQWALLVLETLQGQVDNGGFFGLFDNAGEYFLDAMDAARVVGARPFIPLLDEVREKLPDGIPLDDHDERERLEPLVSGLDDRFYEARKVEGLDLFDFALRFAGAHPEEFFLTEPEADADLTDFIDRLRARIGNQPTATQEQAAGLPPTARAVYTRVGRPEGDWGPWAEGDYFVDPAEPAGPVYLRDEDGVERWVAASLRGWLENWLRVAS